MQSVAEDQCLSAGADGRQAEGRERLTEISAIAELRERPSTDPAWRQAVRGEPAHLAAFGRLLAEFLFHFTERHNPLKPGLRNIGFSKPRSSVSTDPD
jgi:hypothetical protein